MTDGTISRDFGDMTAGAEALARCATRLLEAVNVLEAEAKPLVNVWVASGSSAAGSWQKTQNDMHAVINGLAEFASSLGTELHMASADGKKLEGNLTNVFQA